jgi:tRNA/rRNA methyltransferase
MDNELKRLIRLPFYESHLASPMTEILNQVSIILVEPSGALNLGSIARVMKNFGLKRLVLVNPQCDPLSPEARQMAVHAGDLLETVIQVATLPEALVGCQRAIATTARGRTLPTDFETPAAALPWLIEPQAPNSHSALIFGREDRGLSNDELNYAQRFIRIPSSPDYSSLNLAQAVAVCCYELYQTAHQFTQQSSAATDPVPLATLDELEGYYQHLEALLLKIGYLYPHTATTRMEKFRRLFNRADLSSQEVAMLRGILSQMQWAIQHDRGAANGEVRSPDESLASPMNAAKSGVEDI